MTSTKFGLIMRNEKLKQAKKYIPDLNVMTQTRALHRTKYGLAWQYRFSITTSKGVYRAIFTDSIYNHDNNIQINLDDILYSWIVDASCFDCSKDFNEFCLEYGYDFKQYDIYDNKYRLSKQQAKAAWMGCKHAYNRMVKLLTPEQIIKLHDIFQDY